jgi:hypothetical protein
MATTTLKKKDDEFSILVLVCGIFTLTLVICDFFYAKWGSMNFWILALAVIFHAVTAFAWYKVIRNWQDPNYDYWRKILVAAAIAGILVVMGHRAGWIENQMFEKDVEKAKTGAVTQKV